MAVTPYAYSISTDFPNQKVDSSRLAQEIRDSAIVVALDGILVEGDACTISFKEALSAGDETILDGIVAAHSGEPLVPDLPVQPVKTIDTSSLDPNTANTRLKGFEFTAAAKDQGTDGKWTAYDVSFPYEINLLLGEGPSPAEGSEDDIMEFFVDPDRVIGGLIQAEVEGAEVIHVSPTVLQNIKPGFHVAVGVGGDLHEVVAVNLENSTLSIVPNLEGDKPAGSYILRTIKYCETIHLTPGEPLDLGGQTSGSATVPAGVVLRVRYWNAQETPVRVKFRLVYKY
jgi:hypothetical protein